jgi:DNA-binding ferritin-like protein
MSKIVLADGSNDMSTILSFLEALEEMYEHMHWHSSGNNYYGDHLLYERLYDEIEEEIDSVAEKAIGIFGPDSIGPNKNTAMTANIVSNLISDTDTADKFPILSIKAEEKFISIVSDALTSMEKDNELTDGIDNLLQGVVDLHESHLYLLKQRNERREAMMSPLVALYKIAYILDTKGMYNEAKEIEKVMESMAERVGIKPDDMIALADYFDQLGETALANKFDELVKEASKKKTKYKTYKGPGEKKPEGAEHKAPKKWWNEQVAEIKKKNPDYSSKRVSEIVGDIWDNQLSDAKRSSIYKRYSKTKSPNK